MYRCSDSDFDPMQLYILYEKVVEDGGKEGEGWVQNSFSRLKLCSKLLYFYLFICFFCHLSNRSPGDKILGQISILVG